MTTTTATRTSQRDVGYAVMADLVRHDPRIAVVLAEIGAAYLDLADAPDDVRRRVVNVGIREQLAISVAGGLALAGLRPIVHTFPPFLLERPFEQVKLDLDHQGVGAVLVSALGSYDWPEGGETHMGRRDVALLDTLEGWAVHVPGHPAEAETLLRLAAAGTGKHYVRLTATDNSRALLGAGDDPTRMVALRRGRRGTVVAVGPLADRVLEATEGLDVTVLYAATVRPFDTATLVDTMDRPDVVVVEPYLAGTSDHEVSRALAHVPHRVLGLGVARETVRRYGTVAEHDRHHGLDIAGLRRSIGDFLT